MSIIFIVSPPLKTLWLKWGVTICGTLVWKGKSHFLLVFPDCILRGMKMIGADELTTEIGNMNVHLCYDA